MKADKIQLYNRSPKIVLAEQEGEAAVMKGYATLYDSATDLYWYTLSIDRQAFKESVEAQDDVVSLFNHDGSMVLGRTPKTLKVEWDHEFGLWQETILPKHYLGEMVREEIERGTLNQMSVAFTITEETFNNEGDKPHFHVTKARLEDVSAVTWGQYPDTTLEVDAQKLFAEHPTEEQFRKRLQRHLDNEREREDVVQYVCELERKRIALRRKKFGLAESR